MSATVNIAGGVSARSGVLYALYGRGQQYVEHMKRGTHRAAAYASSMGSPEEFIAYAEAQAARSGRKYETYNLVLAGNPKVFNVDDPDNIKKMLALSVGLSEAAFSAEYLVVIHDDSKGEHLHGHIYVVNHDEATGKALKRNTSWTRGLRQLNDELLVEAGYVPNLDPQRPKPDWELRREEFKPGGFEQTLGDRVYESLADPRSTNPTSFVEVLAEHGVRLKVTGRDGWTYSMRREDNGQWGRKKASVLTPEFTADGAQQIFDYHAQKGATHGVAGHDEAGRRAAVDYGDAGGVDVAAARRRAAAHEPDGDRRRPDRVREGDGRAAGQAADPAVDLAAARAALDAAARRRDEEQAERDREDARRRRLAAERQRSREAARRIVSASVGSGGARDDDEDQRDAGDDEPDFG
ncbi:relaxase/mobilization nuclease domain-containing protein [Rhodococcus pyridinivorans]|uniref:relaxase/mobilization nuclease domain-containing protein n=1 Tax=Rhodococcus pyridinivorans TaxID=103816 RepID=UPI00110FFE1B|nr:relaxase/mobilization nuclease domain-containing protein [Rhodococcus pyridinivorans]MCD2141368.1 relaxase/mobilization nuclease domain-containing protein [Rhodococcus pyridinivorans]